MISRSWLTASSSYLTNGGESSPPFLRKNEPNFSFRISKTMQKRTQNEPKRTQNEPNFQGRKLESAVRTDREEGWPKCEAGSN